MALFGLSPLFLSFLASSFFTNTDGLDVTRFLKFMALFSGAIHLIGAIFLETFPAEQESLSPLLSDFEQSGIDERAPLLPREARPESVRVINADGSVLDLFRDISFWVLAAVVFVVLGSVGNFSFIWSGCNLHRLPSVKWLCRI
jgi:hypothetical protein